MMVVEFGGVLIHDLFSHLEGIMMLEFRSGLALLLVRMPINKQVFDRTCADGSLIHVEGRGKLSVSADPDLVEKVEGKVLAVIVDEVVSRVLLSHEVNGHLAWYYQSVHTAGFAREKNGPS